MKVRGLLLLLIMSMSSLTLMAQAAPAVQSGQAQAAPDLATVLNRQLSNLENELVPASDAMPEEKFSFQTTKETMSFARQVRHAAATNYYYCSGILGEKPPVDLGPDSEGPDLKTKAELVKFMKDSFAYAHKAFSTINEKNATELVGKQQRATRLGLAIATISHGSSHYGQIVQYLRMSNVVPPASRPR